MRSLGLLGALPLLAFSALPQTTAQRDLRLESRGRKALVIGNDTYPSAPLRTAAGDAAAIAATLKQLNFTVTLATDADLRKLEQSIDEFVAGLTGQDIAVVFFSGYAIQIGGENYLTPVGFAPKDTADAKYVAYSASRLLDRVQARGPRAAVLILDACRPHPFRIVGLEAQGLAPMNAGPGSVVFFAAAPGKTAVDSAGSRSGLFAGFLLDALRTPGLRLDQILSTVRDKVYQASNQGQLPVSASSAEGNLQLNDGRTSPPAGSFEAEFTHWTSIKDSPDPDRFRAHLERFPEGVFSGEASQRIGKPFIAAVPAARPSRAEQERRTGFSKVPQIPENELRAPFTFSDDDLRVLEQASLLDRQMDREGLVDNDPKLEAYLAQVGSLIVPHTPERVTWRFRALRDPVPNAFALPNGSIYVNAGLIALLDNESQLASVLAHEITHVTARHGYLSVRSYRKKMLATNLLKGAANWAPGDTSWGASLRILGAVVPAILQCTITGYARELERLADLYAVNKLLDTGYDPNEMTTVFRKLEQRFEVQSDPIFYNDHPKLEDRIQYVNSFVEAKAAAESGPPVVQAAQYRAITERLCRAAIQLAIDSQRYRTAVHLAKRLSERNPRSPDNLWALAESYRQLGPRVAEAPAVDKKTVKEEQKLKSSFTPEEETRALMARPDGAAAMRANAQQAEAGYRQALHLDPNYARANRGLGILYEQLGDTTKARQNYQRYLQLQPAATDRMRIERRLENLDQTLKSPGSVRR